MTSHNTLTNEIEFNNEFDQNEKNNIIVNQKQNHLGNSIELLNKENMINVPIPELSNEQSEEDKKYSNKNININTNSINTSENFFSKNEYNERALNLINQIRTDPNKYALTIEENKKYIKYEKNITIDKETGVEQEKIKTVFKKKVKVLLYQGEKKFNEAKTSLQLLVPMKKLKLAPEIVLPLPNSEAEIKNQDFINSKANDKRNCNININVYFKDYIRNPEEAIFLMIVDDNKDDNTKRRSAILNPEYTKIGIDSKFIGKNFIAHYSFSK